MRMNEDDSYYLHDEVLVLLPLVRPVSELFHLAGVVDLLGQLVDGAPDGHHLGRDLLLQDLVELVHDETPVLALRHTLLVLQQTQQVVFYALGHRTLPDLQTVLFLVVGHFGLHLHERPGFGGVLVGDDLLDLLQDDTLVFAVLLEFLLDLAGAGGFLVAV